jgi:hypothetical protein
MTPIEQLTIRFLGEQVIGDPQAFTSSACLDEAFLEWASSDPERQAMLGFRQKNPAAALWHLRRKLQNFGTAYRPVLRHNGATLRPPGRLGVRPLTHYGPTIKREGTLYHLSSKDVPLTE